MRKRTVMNTIALLTFFAILLTAQIQMQASAAGASKASDSTTPRTLTGTVSDSTCGASHVAKDKSPAECTRECLRAGSKYALVVGQRVYTLDGHEAEVDKFAGEKATVKGRVTGEKVTVESVTAAKLTH